MGVKLLDAVPRNKMKREKEKDNWADMTVQRKRRRAGERRSLEEGE